MHIRLRLPLRPLPSVDKTRKKLLLAAAYCDEKGKAGT